MEPRIFQPVIKLQETEAPKNLFIFYQKKAVLMFWEKRTPKKVTCKA